MNLDDAKVYIFVRQDLPIEQQLVQATHAAFHAGLGFTKWYGNVPGIPFHVLVGMPNAKALDRVRQKFEQHKCYVYVMTDTDVDPVNPTALASYPLFGKDAEFLRNYRLWRYVPGAEQSAGLKAEPGANAAVAQMPCS